MNNSNVGLNPGSSSQTPATSPPPYTESVDQSFKPTPGSSGGNESVAGQQAGNTQQGVPGTMPMPQPYYPSDAFTPQQQHHHPLFGPTPLSSQPLVPYAYYDPHSPYSLALADSRARWRFLGALAWAVCIWLLVGLLVGTEVEIALGRGRLGGAGSWAKA